MSKHKNRKMSNAVERVQQATKDQADATMASKQIQQATKDQVDTAMASEQIQQATKDQRNATMTSANTLATSVQTIATAHADYAKKAMQEGSDFFAKLTSVKEPSKVMELHSEYVKNSYETFVAEAKKISELYTDFFKQTTKPFEALIAKNKAA
jgi:phasin family protein